MPYFYPKSGFIISGENLNFVDRVIWGDDSVDVMEALGTTGLSGRLPPQAKTAQVFVESATDSISLGTKGVILAAGNQIKASELDAEFVSGRAGDLISLRGENYYNITEVNFGNISSEFSMVASDEIQAVVPENADYSKITVFNGLNTGLDGSITEASGLSVNEFVPIPQITGLSSGQLVSGETLTIMGSSFSGVTGVTFNDISVASISVSSSTGINVVIPSGNASGPPRFLLKSGQYVDSPVDFTFTPAVRVDDIKDSAGASIPVGGGLKTGELFKLEGANFSTGILYATGEGYLWGIGDSTGIFSVIDNSTISGLVPQDISRELTGELNPSLAALDLKIYSPEYPRSYKSSVTFPPSVGSPVISHYVPDLTTLPFLQGGNPNAFTSGAFPGISGDVVTAFGDNLIGITGINFRPVGAGTVGITAASFAASPDGKSLSFTVPDIAGIHGTYGWFFNVYYSGLFGENTGISSFYAIGDSYINNQTYGGAAGTPGIEPAQNVTPGSTGILRGRNFISGSNVLLYKDDFSDANLVSTLPTSGYKDSYNWGEVNFSYPNSFRTGVDYKITVENVKGLATGNPWFQDFSVETINAPFLSGFLVVTGSVGDFIVGNQGNYSKYAASGEAGDTVLVSGSFFNKSGANGNSPLFVPYRIGEASGGAMALNTLDPAYPGFLNTSGIYTPFYSISIPQGAVSDTITITTDGGTVTSTDLLTIYPNKPIMSGFYPGEGASPYSTGVTWSSQNYFGGGNALTVTGERMGLVTGVEFSGLTDTFSTNVFSRKTASSLVFNVPTNVNTSSGVFQLVDFKSRKVSSVQGDPFPSTASSEIKMVKLSGISEQVLPGGEFLASGNELIAATQVFFPAISGGEESSILHSYINHGNDMWTSKYYVPTGIEPGTIRFAYEDFVNNITINRELFNSSVPFFPLTRIGGIDPLPVYVAPDIVYGTGANVVLTGLNASSSAGSGALLVGITGTGHKGDEAEVYFYPISNYATGSGIGPNIQYAGAPPYPNVIYNQIDFQFDSGFIGTGSLFVVNPWENFDDIRNEFIGSDSEKYLVSQTWAYPGPFRFAITGTRVNVTGYGPTRGITGSYVEVTGEGLDPVTGTFFKVDNGPYLEADFTINSNSHITITVPKEGVETRGMTDIILSGGTNDVIPNFEILLDTTVLEFNTLTEGDGPITSTRTSQYTIEENDGGVVYLVTKTRFPDGTTAVVSSVPKP